jgi:hypothetical protein
LNDKVSVLLNDYLKSLSDRSEPVIRLASAAELKGIFKKGGSSLFFPLLHASPPWNINLLYSFLFF